MKKIFFLLFSFPCILLSQSNWQQNADYKMNVDIDVESFRLTELKKFYIPTTLLTQ